MTTNPANLAEYVCFAFRTLHAQIRSALAETDDEIVNTVPSEGANSIAVLVSHTLGSEAETITTVAGGDIMRDRSAEFRVRPTLGELHELLRLADDRLQELLPVLRTCDLDEPCTLPTKDPADRKPRAMWLLRNLGHAHEHYGQILLTKDRVKEVL